MTSLVYACFMISPFRHLISKHPSSGMRAVALAFFCSIASGFAAQNTTPDLKMNALQPGQMPYFDAVGDPMEGFNRCSWEVNDWLFRDLFYPVSFGYNFAVPKPIRSMISNGGHNLTYPVRLFNNCCEGKWHGALMETERFGANSTVGLGGLFDPATHWKIGRSDRDFGETLGQWGSGPAFYLMLPILGPSNGRDAWAQGAAPRRLARRDADLYHPLSRAADLVVARTAGG